MSIDTISSSLTSSPLESRVIIDTLVGLPQQIADLAVRIEKVNGKVDVVAADVVEVKSDVAETKAGVKYQNGRVRDIERQLIAKDAADEAVVKERERIKIETDTVISRKDRIANGFQIFLAIIAVIATIIVPFIVAGII